MIARRVNDSELSAMLTKWRGLSGPFTVEQDDDERFFVKDDTGTIVATVEDFDEHTEAIARLFAGATDDVKALGNTVVALSEEIERLRDIISDAGAHLVNVHASDCEGGYRRCACDVEKARAALATAVSQ